jgi:hypothetical protein
MPKPFRIILLVLTILSLAACTLPSGEATPTAPVRSRPPASPMPAPLATASNTATEIPPTLPAANSPAATLPAPTPAQEPVRLTFESGATALQVRLHLVEGAVAHYLLRALKGQVAGAFVDQFGVPLIISSPDGAIFKNQEENVPFWHGVLPQTGDYRIDLGPSLVEADVTLFIRINPPGQLHMLQDLENAAYRFRLAYPDTFFIGTPPESVALLGKPVVSLTCVDSQAFRGTNLVEAYVLISAAPAAQLAIPCEQAQLANEQAAGALLINNTTFARFQRGGAAAGNEYEQVSFRTDHQDTCYQLAYLIHYANIGNYTPGTVREFDRPALDKELMGVIQSFGFIDQ